MSKEQQSRNYSVVWDHSRLSVPSNVFDIPELDTIPIDLRHMFLPIVVIPLPIVDIFHDLVLTVVDISIVLGRHFVVPWHLVGPRLATLEQLTPNVVPWREYNSHILDIVAIQYNDLVLASTDSNSLVTHHHAIRLEIRFEGKRPI